MGKKPRKSNTNASAISDRSGFRFPMNEMVIESGTGYLVHKSESDGIYNLVDHPVNYPTRYARFDDPKPTIGGRLEQEFDGQNKWLGQGYSYTTLKADVITNLYKFTSGSVSMSLTTAGSTFIPTQNGGLSNWTLTTSVAGTTVLKLASGSSPWILNSNCSVTVKTGLTGSFSSAFSSAYDRQNDFLIEYIGSGSSPLVLTTTNSFTVLGGSTGSGNSSIALTTVCSVTIKSVLGMSGFSSSFSPAYS